jgi:glutamate carboxypeptidase
MSNSLRDRILTWVDEHEEDFMDRWKTLVNIDSGTYCPEGVNRVGVILQTVLEKCGYEFTIYPQEKYGTHRVGVKKGAGKGRLLLVGHTDTVFPEGDAQKRPFRIENGRAYGPGVHDMKGGLVVMTAACEALQAARYNDFASITVLLNSDEEIGSPTSRTLIEEEAKKADYVFVFEPARTDRSLVTARKGVGMYSIAVEGRAAHAGADPQAGISAIEELAHKTIAMHQLNNYETGTTVNVGVFKGGTRSNVVAEQAKADIDVRIFTPAEADRIDQALRDITNQEYLAGAKSILSGGLNRPPMVKDAGTIRLLELVKESGRELGIQITDVASGGASDGNFTNAVGAPTIDSMGTVGGLAHGISEYSEVDSLLEKIKLTALTAMKIKKIV